MGGLRWFPADADRLPSEEPAPDIETTRASPPVGAPNEGALPCLARAARAAPRRQCRGRAGAAPRQGIGGAVGAAGGNAPRPRAAPRTREGARRHSESQPLGGRTDHDAVRDAAFSCRSRGWDDQDDLFSSSRFMVRQVEVDRPGEASIRPSVQDGDTGAEMDFLGMVVRTAPARADDERCKDTSAYKCGAQAAQALPCEAGERAVSPLALGAVGSEAELRQRRNRYRARVRGARCRRAGRLAPCAASRKLTTAQ